MSKGQMSSKNRTRKMRGGLFNAIGSFFGFNSKKNDVNTPAPTPTLTTAHTLTTAPTSGGKRKRTKKNKKSKK